MQNPGPANKLHPKTALGEIARVFLRLGFIAFGGPAAHMALMEEEFVRRRAWVTRERFLDLVGAVSLLPGPSSTELAIYLGQIRGGVLGLILAGAAFILPAALLVVSLAWTRVSLPALALAAVCALLVFCYRVNSAWVIVGAAVAGVLFSIFH